MKRALPLVASCALAPAALDAAVTITPIATGFGQTTSISQNSGAPGDLGIYVAQKDGLLERYDRPTGTISTVLDLRGSIVTDGEQGLIGLAFDPDYATNGRYYVHVNTRPGGAGPTYSEIRRFTNAELSGSPEAETTIFRTQQTGFTNHKGGWIGFDRSGMLMIALGDGGGGNDPLATGQNPGDHFGSILRIDPRYDAFSADPNQNYAIPTGNLAGAAPEVYAYGLRNPFQNSIAPDGNLIVADVGQGAREEISILAPFAADRNFGWVLREGDIATPGAGGPEPADHVDPAFVYDQSQGDRTVIGGFVYRGTAVPELYGRYVFGDQGSGRIWSIQYTGTDLVDGTRTLIGTVAGLTAFGETAEGELLVGQYAFNDTGRVFQLFSDAPPVPEPGSWALMLAGFGLVGYALRRRGASGPTARSAGTGRGRSWRLGSGPATAAR